MSGRHDGIPRHLLAKARAGDDRALTRLVEAAHPLVRRWALVQLGSPADADDLAQDVMVKMLRRLDTFDERASFETWLYSMTRNAALDRFRRGRRARKALEDPRARASLLPDAAPSPAATAEAAELRALLDSLFSKLPERQREAFDLVELQGLDATEAASLMGLEPVSVRAHLFKARRRMRSLILSGAPEVAEELS